MTIVAFYKASFCCFRNAVVRASSRYALKMLALVLLAGSSELPRPLYTQEVD
jgi:hypothetical protein